MLGSASESWPEPVSPVAWRPSRRRVSTCPQKYSRYSFSPLCVASVHPSLGLRRCRPPSWARPVAGLAGYCIPRGIWRVPSRGRCVGSPTPGSDRCCALGPRQTHSRRDVGLYLGYSPSGTVLPYPTGSCSMSTVTGPICADAEVSALPYLQVPPLSAPLRFLFLSRRSLGLTSLYLGPPPLSVLCPGAAR